MKLVLYTKIDFEMTNELGLDMDETAVMCAVNDMQCLDVDGVINPHDGDFYRYITGLDILQVCPYFETEEKSFSVVDGLHKKGLLKTHRSHNGKIAYALSSRGSQWNGEIVL